MTTCLPENITCRAMISVSSSKSTLSGRTKVSATSTPFSLFPRVRVRVRSGTKPEYVETFLYQFDENRSVASRGTLASCNIFLTFRTDGDRPFAYFIFASLTLSGICRCLFWVNTPSGDILKRSAKMQQTRITGMRGRGMTLSVGRMMFLSSKDRAAREANKQLRLRRRGFVETAPNYRKRWRLLL